MSNAIRKHGIRNFIAGIKTDKSEYSAKANVTNNIIVCIIQETCANDRFRVDISTWRFCVLDYATKDFISFTERFIFIVFSEQTDAFFF